MRHVFNIAPRVVVYPHGSPPPPVEEGWLALPRLDAHAVFGDGSHPTTRLCAGAVDLLCRQRPGLSVLDVGTGTGILARIAAARGASYVVGTDIDSTAVACARAHAELDNRAVADVHFGSEAPDHWGARFDVVVANILEAPLHALTPALCRTLKPEGVLLISGFTRPQAPALRLAYETAGLQSAGSFGLDDWVLLRFSQSFSK
jgi:ribosomal protein L11 methyltransferase